MCKAPSLRRTLGGAASLLEHHAGGPPGGTQPFPTGRASVRPTPRRAGFAKLQSGRRFSEPPLEKLPLASELIRNCMK